MVALLHSKHNGNFCNTQAQFHFSRSVQAQSIQLLAWSHVSNDPNTAFFCTSRCVV